MEEIYITVLYKTMWRLFFAKKKVKDPMPDGFKKILQRNFQFKESFLRSAGENNAH